MTADTEEFPPIIRLEKKADDTTAFLRAARSGNLEKVVEYLDTDLDINTANSNGLNALHLASKDGHVEIVTELLKRGAKVDAATKKGNTALHIASLAGQSEIVNILIQYGAAVNIQSQNGFTPLYMAAQENHDSVVKLLLSNGANQSLATEDGFTPLAVAMQQGHDKVVSVLLENDLKGKVRLPALHIAAKKDDCKAADLLLQNDHKPDVTSKSGFTPLHIAAHYGNEEIARLLIKRGADVNYLAKHNISPLHVAAKWGKNNMVKILLENSAIIDAKTRDGLTPLHCAARSGHEQVVSTFLENSAPISARTKNGLAPLHMASQGDHVDAARVLLYHRAPVDEVTIDYLTSLHVAAHCGHVRVAKLLLDRKADPNARALNGFTPLHIACKKNRIKVVELLLKHGASIESTTESGLTPLHVASFMGCMNIVIYLLQHEANPDVPTVRGETPLHLAARANQTDIIRILLRNGAKVDARAREQQTPLHIASRLGNIDIVMLLLQHGAAVDTTTKDMYTALHIAAKEGQEEVAAILVENNASLKATTKNGFTPMHIAAKYGNLNVAKILLQKDSKLDAQGKNDITPLHLACHYDHPNVANLLLEKGASAHLASQNGHTPLHIAAKKNQMDIASTLLENGANANAKSKAGFTPLHLSAQKGHYDMTNLLIEHGADPNHKSRNGLTALHLCAQEDFIRVASILVKNRANVESQTETGYRPIHIAAHFGNLSMIRFLLKHNAEIDVKTNQNYTPLHQAAQQGHAHIVTALLEGNADHKAVTDDGLTPLNIAQKLGYISVMEVLKGLSYDRLTPDNKNWEEKYKVIAPESLQETSFMSDSDDEGGSDALISEQPYRYLTADLMKSLRDDSLPIDVTRDDPIHRQVSKDDNQDFTQSNNYCLAENFDTNDGLNLGRLHFRSFLVSFLVDARGGAMRGCRHSGVRIIVPPRRATMPIRVTCRLVKPSKVANPPPLMEGEALATRIIEMGPVSATFLGPVLLDVPHAASARGKEREIIIMRSENGETWKEHDNLADNDDTLLNTPYDSQMSTTHSGRITRIVTTEFPQYFAIITRIKQEVHVIGAEGGILISSVANHVQAVFPRGALTKKIKVGLQAHVIPAELTAKLLGNCVAVSPVITIEPRRRKFHKPITLTIPVPQAANKGMINQYGGETPTLRLLCSIAGGTSEAQWEDVTGSTPLAFMNDRVSFTTTVSARFWLMDCRNISEVPKMATELYKESLYVPFITNFVIYSKKVDVVEATLRVLCMTDGKEGMHTLETQEEFTELVKSRDVEALDGKDLYIEFSGNLVPVTKSGVQLKFTFRAFRQNRLSFHLKIKDPLLDPVARMLFMREPRVPKGDPPQQPICVLNILLQEIMSKVSLQKLKGYEDSNKFSQKEDSNKSKYKSEKRQKIDELGTSPSETKFIADTLEKEQTDAAIHESFAQKAACPLESVGASYPNKAGDQESLDLSSIVEKQTYSEKRQFWEDISKKRESYQRSESEMSRTSQLTINESDSEYLQNVVSEEDTTEAIRSETMEDMNIPDISECSVAEKAHYFEEQIQKEMAKVPPKLQQQESVKSEKDKVIMKVGKTEEQKMTESFEKGAKEIEKEKVVEEQIIQVIKEPLITEVKKEPRETKIEKEKRTFESEKDRDVAGVSSQPVKDVCQQLLDKEREIASEDVSDTTVSRPIFETVKRSSIKVKEAPAVLEDTIIESKLTEKEQIILTFVSKDKIVDTTMEKLLVKEKQTEISAVKEKESKIPTFMKEKADKEEIGVKHEPKKEEEITDDNKQSSQVVEESGVKILKKDFESRIPVSFAKTDKEKTSKEIKKISPEAKLSPKPPGRSPEQAEASPIGKKKEFELRIPKRIGVFEKDLKKGTETFMVTENKSVEKTKQYEEHSTTKKTETQTFTKTFTDPQEAFNTFEGMGGVKDKDFKVVTSKVDHKASSKSEKKEVTSSEISSGKDKFFVHEEMEQTEAKKTSESKLTKESLGKLEEERKAKSEKLDSSAVQKMSAALSEGKQTIDATAVESRVMDKKKQEYRSVQDEEGVLTRESGTSQLKKGDVGVAIRAQRDSSKSSDQDDIQKFHPADKDLGKVDILARDERRDEKIYSYDTETFVPNERREETEEVQPSGNFEEMQRQKFKEIEVRTIALEILQSIESEIEKRVSDSLREEMGQDCYDRVMTEIEDEELADDLTRKFESMKKKDLMEAVDKEGKAKLISEEGLERTSVRDSFSISEDITKDEESSSQAKLADRDITMSPSSISDQAAELEMDTNEMDASKPISSLPSDKDRSSLLTEQLESEAAKNAKLAELKLLGEDVEEKSYDFDYPKDKKVTESYLQWNYSGARVLEILEPEQEGVVPEVSSQSRQDSIDVPSIEMDDHKLDQREIPLLHESPAMDSLDRIAQERDITMSPSTVSEDTNAEYSFNQEYPAESSIPVRRVDSFEIGSPPMISPKSKVQDLEIQSVNWMIGDEKIEITETLQPSQVFNQELEEYESAIREGQVLAQEFEEFEGESATKSSEDTSAIDSVKETVAEVMSGDSNVTIAKTSKFTVVPVTEQDFESDLIENKLDISCQELIDTLQREYDAKTPTEDYGLRRGSTREADFSMDLTEENLIKDSSDETQLRDNFSIIETQVKPLDTQESSRHDSSSIHIDYRNNEKEAQPKEAVEEKSEVKEKTERKMEKRGADESLKEWTETYLPKVKSTSEEHKRHIEKSFDKHERAGRSSGTASDTCAFKIRKDDLPNVDLSTRYAITVLDQVVKKEIAEVKESLEAAKQDLIEELSENSETVFQIKDSPSEFQFKIQPESIPNDLPLLYKPPSLEQDTGDRDSTSSDSPVAKPRKQHEKSEKVEKEESERVVVVEEATYLSSGSFEEPVAITKEKNPCADIVVDKSESSTAVQEESKRSKDSDESQPSPVPTSRSGSDQDYKDDSSSLLAPRPVPRRRQKPSKASSKKVASESDDLCSSSGESSNYQSCDYGSGSRPSSSEIEALQSTGQQISGSFSEYETAQMSLDRSSKPTSQDYHTAASTLSSHESMKSLSSLSSGHLGSIDSTSELSETLVASEPEMDKDEIDENLDLALDEDIVEGSPSSASEDIPVDESVDKIDSNIPFRMKRSSEMVFQQVIDDSATLDDRSMEEHIEPLELDVKLVDSATSVSSSQPVGTIQSVDIMTSRVTEAGVQSVCTQVISTEKRLSLEKDSVDISEDLPGDEDIMLDEQVLEECIEGMIEGGIPIPKHPHATMLMQASMSVSSASGVSLDTVVEREKLDRQSPDSDSFELVDKPDIIDDFVVIEEVGREAEEFDAEGKSIRICSTSQVISKGFDRDMENLMTDANKETEVSTSQTSNKSTELFDFETEESPPQASTDEQSQGYSDEEQYEGGKKWMQEMQFHAETRAIYDMEYDRGPLEDIKEEEVTDFEAGSSRFGSLGSHKESIGSVGSMRGSLGSTPEFDMLAGKKYLLKSSDHDNVSLSSLQEFEHLENALAAENAKRLSGSTDSTNNGSLPRRHVSSRSGCGDDVSLSSLKDFEGLEKACREAHLIQLRAREEEDLLEHESPENKYKLENIPRPRPETSSSCTGSINPSTSGSDDYERRIKEIDEIIRIAQSNVEKLERQDDTAEDISQMDTTDLERATYQPSTVLPPATEEEEIAMREANIMETSTDSLELDINDKKNPLCRSSDSLEMKTTLDIPSLSSDSLNNMRETKETQQAESSVQYAGGRRISSDSLDLSAGDHQDKGKNGAISESDASQLSPNSRV
ncbi:ankyrin-2-like [Prorops nasuta]|uniref:ankyrin-2-like n=1 Tax=Prorops nasuta TaxID=863751 RepID=UPI0034CE356F